MSTTLEDIKTLIQNGHTKSVFEPLLEISEQDNDFQNKIRLIFASFNEMQQQAIEGVVLPDELDTKKNQINKRLLDLISSQEEPVPPDPAVANEEEDNDQIEKKVIEKLEKSAIEGLHNSSKKEAHRWFNFAKYLLAGGMLLLIIALILNISKNDSPPIFVFLVGLVTSFGSSPFFVVYYKEKEKARRWNDLLIILGPRKYIMENGFGWKIVQANYHT